MAKCLAALEESESFARAQGSIAPTLENLVARYPELDSARVCEEVRDYASRHQVRSPRGLLEAFFENAERKRASELMSPHSPQAEQAKLKAYRADWYSAYFEVFGAEAQRMTNEAQRLREQGMNHDEILAALRNPTIDGESTESDREIR